MFCSSCGTHLPDNAQFCMKCGQPQRADIQTGADQEVRHETCEIHVVQKKQKLIGPLIIGSNYYFEAAAIGAQERYTAAQSGYVYAVWENQGEKKILKQTPLNRSQ